jgi:hypothetical protein
MTDFIDRLDWNAQCLSHHSDNGQISKARSVLQLSGGWEQARINQHLAHYPVIATTQEGTVLRKVPRKDFAQHFDWKKEVVTAGNLPSIRGTSVAPFRHAQRPRARASYNGHVSINPSDSLAEKCLFSAARPVFIRRLQCL